MFDIEFNINRDKTYRSQRFDERDRHEVEYHLIFEVEYHEVILRILEF